jgi:hypothetical protein
VAATLSDGTALTYLVDGETRRVGRQVDGGLQQVLLYRDARAS